MERLQVVGLVSGGKDSCFAMLKCIEYGHQIVALANLMPLDDSVDELDSYMYQTVGHQIVVSYAECMGLPLFRRRIKGSTRHDHLRYTMTPGDEVEDMFILLNEVKRQIPSVTAVSSGAIASDYQRLRVESVCSRLGLVSLAYLWKQDQSLLLQEMITKGIVAIIIKVAAMGLNPAKHLGKDLASLQPHLLQLKEMYGINVCGEGGEYETLTLDCPLFTNARILLDEYQVILHSSGSIAPVGILHPSAFHLEPKEECASSSSCCQGDNAASEKMGCLYEVKGDLLDGFKDQAMDFVSIHVITKGNLITSRTEGDTFSMGCWIQDSSGTSEGLQKDLTAVMKKIESRLGEDGFDWVNVLYIHLYLDDMNEFASANETYVSFIAEKSFHCGVPSRSTIQLPLTQVGLGKAYVEVLVANDTRKRVLHVQSISCWAPSCIGPYSQATLHKEVLLMAGQLGLHPPTMTLCPGGPRAELEQALRNCEAVAECFNCTLSASAILFVIYCSESVTSSGRAEIQDKQEALLVKQSHRQISKVPNPVFLYVLVPNLPKRALVEVKPVLYVPEITESTSQTDTMPHMNVSNCWGYEHLEWHDSCCKKYVIWGKICMAIVSVTNEVVAKLRSETNQNMGDDSAYFGTEANMRRAARFLISLLHQILLEHGFSWQDIMNLRIYFSTELDLAMSILRMVFTEAFREFAGITHRTETGSEDCQKKDCGESTQSEEEEKWAKPKETSLSDITLKDKGVARVPPEMFPPRVAIEGEGKSGSDRVGLYFTDTCQNEDPKSESGSDQNSILVKFLPRWAMETDIDMAFCNCGSIEAIRINASRNENRFNYACVCFKTKEGLGKALSKDNVTIGGADLVVQAASPLPENLKTTSAPDLVWDPSAPVNLLKDPTRTVMIEGFPHCLASPHLIALSSFGSVSGFVMGSSGSIAYVEFETEEAKEKAIAASSISVSGRQLSIL